MSKPIFPTSSTLRTLLHTHPPAPLITLQVNTTNIKMIAPELFQLNLVRGRGLFARAVMKAQLASPGFTPVFAALVAVVNTKLPENGELILKRVIVAFRRAYKRRDKVVATALAKFIAHMVNQQVRRNASLLGPAHCLRGSNPQSFRTRLILRCHRQQLLTTSGASRGNVPTEKRVMNYANYDSLVEMRQAESCPLWLLVRSRKCLEATELALIRNRARIHARCSFFVSGRNSQVAHELLALQLLTVLLEEPTDDSVEIAVNFTKEIGQVQDLAVT